MSARDTVLSIGSSGSFDPHASFSWNYDTFGSDMFSRDTTTGTNDWTTLSKARHLP